MEQSNVALQLQKWISPYPLSHCIFQKKKGKIFAIQSWRSFCRAKRMHCMNFRQCSLFPFSLIIISLNKVSSELCTAHIIFPFNGHTRVLWIIECKYPLNTCHRAYFFIRSLNNACGAFSQDRVVCEKVDSCICSTRWFWLSRYARLCQVSKFTHASGRLVAANTYSPGNLAGWNSWAFGQTLIDRMIDLLTGD